MIATIKTVTADTTTQTVTLTITLPAANAVGAGLRDGGEVLLIPASAPGYTHTESPYPLTVDADQVRDRAPYVQATDAQIALASKATDAQINRALEATREHHDNPSDAMVQGALAALESLLTED